MEGDTCRWGEREELANSTGTHGRYFDTIKFIATDTPLRIELKVACIKMGFNALRKYGKAHHTEKRGIRLLKQWL